MPCCFFRGAVLRGFAAADFIPAAVLRAVAFFFGCFLTLAFTDGFAFLAVPRLTENFLAAFKVFALVFVFVLALALVLLLLPAFAFVLTFALVFVFALTFAFTLALGFAFVFALVVCLVLDLFEVFALVLAPRLFFFIAIRCPIHVTRLGSQIEPRTLPDHSLNAKRQLSGVFAML